jgi:hypothetical protein
MNRLAHQSSRPKRFPRGPDRRHSGDPGGCGINAIPTQDEATKTAWAEVQNQYQRRADLMPNLVATVKGYAAQEKSVLVEVTQARASATQVKVDASTITDPAQFQQYAAAQDKLSGVLGRLMMIQEQLSGPEVEPELPGPAKPAGRHREPHHDRAARLQSDRPGLQHDPAHLPERVLGQDDVQRPEAGPAVPGHGRRPRRPDGRLLQPADGDPAEGQLACKRPAQPRERGGSRSPAAPPPPSLE